MKKIAIISAFLCWLGCEKDQKSLIPHWEYGKNCVDMLPGEGEKGIILYDSLASKMLNDATWK